MEMRPHEYSSQIEQWKAEMRVLKFDLSDEMMDKWIRDLENVAITYPISNSEYVIRRLDHLRLLALEGLTTEKLDYIAWMYCK